MEEQFYTILTAAGRAMDAASKAAGTALDLSDIAVGDGLAGAYYEPAESQLALKHEVWRGPLVGLAQDPENPSWVVAVGTIPVDAGGFTIREVGVFAADGTLYAVAKFPATVKPLLADGAGKEMVLKIIMETSNAANVTLTLDPSAVYAQQADLSAHVNQTTGAHHIRRIAHFFGRGGR